MGSNQLPFHMRYVRRACAALMFSAALGCIAQDGKPAADPLDREVAPSIEQKAPAEPSPLSKALSSSEPSVDSEKRQQISAASTQLLAMAVDLKAEVDKTTRDTLSMSVIRKADALERLAKSVKDKPNRR